MNVIEQLALVAAGGFAGAVGRYVTIRLLPNARPFPIGTFFVNMAGSFMLGWLTASGSAQSIVYIFFGIGFLGAFTTFSTVMLELLQQIGQKKYFIFMLYSTMTYLLGFIFAVCGYILGSE